MKETRYTLAKYELNDEEEKIFTDACELALDLSRKKDLPEGLQNAFFSAYSNLSDLFDVIEEFKTKGIILKWQR